MAYGYGYGYGRGRGIGFRGGLPPWPYVGRGRGGFPRCWYPELWDYPPPAYYDYGPWEAPYYPQTPFTFTREQEIASLKEEAEAIKDDLASIEQRIAELEGKGD